jgi:predicted DCC family thiol-disulfide oxidoreductase YuxK
MHVGVDAFLLIWQQIPRWRMLGVLVGLPLVRRFANTAYHAFATWRFKRLSHCQLALKEKQD